MGMQVLIVALSCLASACVGLRINFGSVHPPESWCRIFPRWQLANLTAAFGSSQLQSRRQLGADSLRTFAELLVARDHPSRMAWSLPAGPVARPKANAREPFSSTSSLTSVAKLRGGLPGLSDAPLASTRLVTSYVDCTAMLLDEIADTKAGDEIELGIYLLEGGESSEQLLVALEEAGAKRDVRISFGLDISYVSMISRIIEKTDTLIPRVAELARTQPQWCSVKWGSKPDHSKFAFFTRKGEHRVDTAILGGINFGDRFKTWDDYAVRLQSPYAEELRSTMSQVETSPERVRTWLGEDTVDAARVVAVAGPAVSLINLLTSLALVGLFTVAVPFSALSADPALLLAASSICTLAAFSANIAGAIFATASDGGQYSLGREIAVFARSLVFDRSMLGDFLLPLRRFYHKGGSGKNADASSSEVPTGDTRYLSPLQLPTSKHVQFVANRREQKRYEIEPAFRTLFSDKRLQRYRVAMAYLGHRWGVEMLELALERGATVELLLPARSNVYACENLRAAQTLLAGRWPGLRLYLHPQMVHAKAILASDADGESPVAFLGSANLVRGSMNLPVHCGLLPYDELNVLLRDSQFCNDLNASMDSLFKNARLVGEDEQLLNTEWYSDNRAKWEELWQ